MLFMNYNNKYLHLPGSLTDFKIPLLLKFILKFNEIFQTNKFILTALVKNYRLTYKQTCKCRISS